MKSVKVSVETHNKLKKLSFEQKKSIKNIVEDLLKGVV